jgi:hypothetical protein
MTPHHSGIATVFLPNGKTAPRVRPPWYGYLLFQAAVQPKAAEKAKLGPTRASSSSPGYVATVTSAAGTTACRNGEVKVWPVLHEAVGGKKELRVVVLHKGEDKDCDLVINLSERFRDAVVTRVTPQGSPGGLAAEEVTFGGMSYQDLQPEISGALQSETVTVRSGEAAGAASSVMFRMPKASAALLVAASV